SALNAKQRRQGLLDELDDKPIPADTNNLDWTPNDKALTLGKNGKYRVHARTWTEQVIREDAKKNVEDALGKSDIQNAQRVCMVGLWAYNPPAILKVVKHAGPLDRVKIVAFDEDEDTLDGIRDGDIYGTIVQNPYEFGYRSIK